MKPLLALTLLAALCAPALAADAAAPKPDAAKGQEKAQMCAACHMSDGSRGLPANPIIAGQHADYLVKQLTEFKANKRTSPIMNGMAATLSDDDVRNVAAFFASKSAQPGASKDKDLVQLGERIYRGGIASKQIPACSGCHSPNGAGVPAQFPKLAGQHAEYAEAQLIAFRSGQRANSPQMTAIAARMSDREIKAAADYLTGLR